MLGGFGLVTWKVVYTKQAQKDAKKLASGNLKSKAKCLIQVISENPYQVLEDIQTIKGLTDVDTL